MLFYTTRKTILDNRIGSMRVSYMSLEPQTRRWGERGSAPKERKKRKRKRTTCDEVTGNFKF